MNAADIAVLFDDIDGHLIPLLFRLLPKELAADTFVEMETDQQQMLIKGFSILIIDAWNASKSALEDGLGLSGDGASLLLGTGLIVCIAAVVSAIVLIVRRD